MRAGGNVAVESDVSSADVGNEIDLRDASRRWTAEWSAMECRVLPELAQNPL